MSNFHRLHWINAGRVKLYSQLLLILFLIIGTSYVWNSNSAASGAGGLVFGFSVFWAASSLALSGHASDAYNTVRLSEVVQVIAPTIRGFYGWFYPPAYYLLILPLSLLPYMTSYVLFMLITLGAFVFVVRKIIKGDVAMWCLAAFPGVWVELFTGQNGFLTAAIAGAALVALESRPALSGIFIGLLVIKPHLALLFPVALIAIGAWRVLFIAILVALLLMLGSSLVLGIGTFEAWLNSLTIARLSLENGSLPLSKMPSVFSLLQHCGTSTQLAYAGQMLSAGFALIVVWKIWRKPNIPLPLRNAVLVTSTLLVSPYLYYYDLVWLALPIAWMTSLGLKHGWHPMEREVLLTVWMAPLIMFIGLLVNFGFVYMGPVILLGLIGIIWLRSRKEYKKVISPSHG